MKTASRTKFFIEFYSTCLEGKTELTSTFKDLFLLLGKRKYPKKCFLFSRECNELSASSCFILFPPILPMSESQYALSKNPVLHAPPLPSMCFEVKCDETSPFSLFPPTSFHMCFLLCTPPLSTPSPVLQSSRRVTRTTLRTATTSTFCGWAGPTSS